MPTLTPWVSAVESSEDDAAAPDDAQPEELVSCAFLELAGEPEVKVLARESRVIVEESTHIRERHAAALRPSDRILLDRGMGRWSPAEEFTENVVAAVRASQPELAEMAGEWRRALRAFRDEDHLSMLRLRGLLGAVGIVREEQTIDGWLDLSRASPIAPEASR